MLLSSLINGKGLHPLIEETANLIRVSRKSFQDLILLDLNPEFKNIYKKVDGNDLLIVNELHKAKGFRKLHLELALIESTLQILHCVFFPDPRYDLPIFGVDLIALPTGISAAIVDLSPVDKSLPPEIEREICNLGFNEFKSPKKLPEWGTIFSDRVCFIRPESKTEEKKFQKITEIFIKSLMTYSTKIEPDSYNSKKTIRRYEFQECYCYQQKRNDKTKNVLAKMFSPQWADRYIDVILFECPPLKNN